MKRVFVFVALPIMVLAFLSTIASIGQAQASRFQYAVKFVCGRSNGRIAASGMYFTAINVHNPTYETVKFNYKVTVARTGFIPGPITPFRSTGLRADASFEIDCVDLWKLTETPPRSWLKGFFVIETALELDVIGVYTAAGRDGFVSTMDIERINPSVRQAGGQADLTPILAPDPCPGNERVAFSVKNQGTVTATSSQTLVQFAAGGGFGGAAVTVPTLALAPGASASLMVPIPSGCFNVDCEFRITADSSSLVLESNESNNVVSGTCRG